MIKGSFLRCQLTAAVLARKAVAGQDIAAREGRGPSARAKESEQSNNRRRLDNEGDAPYIVFIFLDDFYFAEEEHRYGILPGDNPEWFVCGAK
jgi:hypothetical protein